MQKHHKISDIGKEQPFKVPGNYFKDLPEQVMEQCQEKEQKRSVVELIKPAISLAAMFIGVALIAYLAIQVIDQPEGKNPYPQEDIAEAEYYDQYYNQNKLMEDIHDGEATQAEQDTEQTDQYIEYLLNEDIDYTTLINELEENSRKGKNNQ